MKQVKTRKLNELQEFAKQTDSLNSSENEELVRVRAVENTPFTIVDIDGYFVAMGKHRLTERFETYEEALKAGEEMTWERILQVIAIMIEELKTN